MMLDQITRDAESVDECAASLGVSRVHLYNEIRYGKLKARKSGRRTIIIAEDKQAYLRSLPSFAPRKAEPSKPRVLRRSEL